MAGTSYQIIIINHILIGKGLSHLQLKKTFGSEIVQWSFPAWIYNFRECAKKLQVKSRSSSNLKLSVSTRNRNITYTILRCFHYFKCSKPEKKQPKFRDASTGFLEITSEKQAQKFHIDDASLPKSGYCFWLDKANSHAARPIRGTTDI